MKEDSENNVFSSYIIGENETSITYFIEVNMDILDNLCDLVLRVLPENLDILESKKYFSITEILEISKEFFKTIDEKYEKDFDEKINNGSYVIYDSEDESSEEYKERGKWVGITTQHNGKEMTLDGDFAIFNKKNDKHRINIPVFHRCMDILDIIHEHTHSLLNKGGFLESVLTEVLPISMEYYGINYLENKGFEKDELSEIVKLRLESLNSVATSLKEAISVYRKNRENIDYSVKINDEQNEIISRKLVEKTRYFIGDLFGICIYEELRDNPKKIDTIKNLINTVNLDTEKGFSSELIEDIIDGIIEYIEENSEEALNYISEKYIKNESVNLGR